MEKKGTKTTLNLPLLYFGLAAAFVAVNALFLFVATNETKTIRLLSKEYTSLEQDQKIIASSQELYVQYRDHIEVISDVFPTEETIPKFIQELEELLRAHADSYSLKFNSLTPQKEGDNLYIILTLTAKTDFLRLTDFFGSLETMPYMTHVAAVTVKNPDGLTKRGEASIIIKVYVQNPFIAK